MAAEDTRIDPVPYAGRLGQRIRELREREKWSTRELAEKAGLGSSTVNRYETDPTANPVLAHLVALARTFRLSSIEELFGVWPTTHLIEHEQPDEAVGE